MPRVATEKKSATEKTEKPATEKKVKSGGIKKKANAYNAYIKREIARLKESEPNTPHKERFSKAASNWKNAKENPKNKSD